MFCKIFSLAAAAMCSSVIFSCVMVFFMRTDLDKENDYCWSLLPVILINTTSCLVLLPGIWMARPFWSQWDSYLRFIGVFLAAAPFAHLAYWALFMALVDTIGVHGTSPSDSAGDSLRFVYKLTVLSLAELWPLTIITSVIGGSIWFLMTRLLDRATREQNWRGHEDCCR